MLRSSHGLDSSLGRDNYAVVEGTIRYSKVGQVSQNLKKELHFYAVSTVGAALGVPTISALTMPRMARMT